MAYKSKRSRPALGDLMCKVRLLREVLSGSNYGMISQHSFSVVATFAGKITTWVGTRYLFGVNQTNDTTHRLSFRTDAAPSLKDNDIIEWDNRRFQFLRYQNIDEKNRFAVVELKEISNIDDLVI